MAYVYRHIRHDKDEPFYIGIGGVVSDDNHSRARNTRSRNKLWKGIASRTDHDVEILFDGVSVDFAVAKEREFIKLYGRKITGDGTLANYSEGGTKGGHKHTDESKRKLSKANKGRKPSQQTINAVIKANTGRPKTRAELSRQWKPVINIDTGVVYEHAGIVADLFGINKRTLRDYLSGRLPNKTPFHYYVGGKVIPTRKPAPKEPLSRGDNGNSKSVVNSETGEVFPSVIDAADSQGISVSALYQKLRGKTKNNTNLTYA